MLQYTATCIKGVITFEKNGETCCKAVNRSGWLGQFRASFHFPGGEEYRLKNKGFIFTKYYLFRRDRNVARLKSAVSGARLMRGGETVMHMKRQWRGDTQSILKNDREIGRFTNNGAGRGKPAYAESHWAVEMTSDLRRQDVEYVFMLVGFDALGDVCATMQGGTVPGYRYPAER